MGEVKTKTDTGVEFTSGGSSNIDSGKVAGNLETKYKVKDLGLTLTEKWTTDNTTSFGIGAKYVLEDGAAVRAKINNKSEIGLGYQQKLRDGVSVTLSTLVNSANFNAGGHKVGLSLEMEV